MMSKNLGEKIRPTFMWLFSSDLQDCKRLTYLIFYVRAIIADTANSDFSVHNDVVIDGPTVRANWYNIWGAAVMVVAMCARFGKSGVSSATCMNFLTLEACVLNSGTS